MGFYTGYRIKIKLHEHVEERMGWVVNEPSEVFKLLSPETYVWRRFKSIPRASWMFGGSDDLIESVLICKDGILTTYGSLKNSENVVQAFIACLPLLGSEYVATFCNEDEYYDPKQHHNFSSVGNALTVPTIGEEDTVVSCGEIVPKPPN